MPSKLILKLVTPVVVKSSCTVTELLLLLQVGPWSQLETAEQVEVQDITVGKVTVSILALVIWNAVAMETTKDVGE